jgi:hypothetical protein
MVLKDKKEFYPIDYITYKKNGKLPSEVSKSMKETKKKGFHILPLTPDTYNVPDEIKAYHAGFKHMKEITIPKIIKLRNDKKTKIKGFFIAEGDLCINEDYDFKTFIKDKHNYPVWLGYKKKLSNYIVGNFLLYFPIKYLNELEAFFYNQTRLVFSDRFFTKLYFSGWLDLRDKSVADEIDHYSSVKKNIRESDCYLDKIK